MIFPRRDLGFLRFLVTDSRPCRLSFRDPRQLRPFAFAPVGWGAAVNFFKRGHAAHMIDFPGELQEARSS